MQLEGTLDTFPLRELIEMVIYSSVTGVLKVQISGDIGQIFFRDGRPYHATAGEHSGINAIGILFEQQNASFWFAADQVSPDITLWMDPWDMMEHGEDLGRQWQNVRRVIPSVDYIPLLIGTPAQSQVHINEVIWPVLSVIDGQRTALEISEMLNLVLLDTCLALVTLIEQGLVKLQHTPKLRPALVPSIAAPPAVTNHPPVAVAASPSGGFLERLLADAKAKEDLRPDLTDERAQERKQVYRYVDDRR